MSFKVIKPSFLSTIQDYGRFGYGKHGLSQSGVMDEHAYCWGNYLLSNHFNDGVIECTFGNLTLEAQTNTFIALTGAEVDFRINNKTASMWCCVQVLKGDILSIGRVKNGIRNYLAVKGGFNSPVLFDSKSVNLRENIGNKLVAEEVLPCEKHTKIKYREIPKRYKPNYQKKVVLRLIPTYQFNDFTQQQRDLFFRQSYKIDNASDRTGCRLKGKPIIKQHPMISEGLSYGSVEITTDGLPIILLKDMPTIGGYPKIGTVFSLDLAKLAQQQANNEVKFLAIDINQAQQARKTFNTFFNIRIN